MIGDRDAAWTVGDVGSVEVEAGEVGLAVAAVNDEIDADRGVVAVVVEGDLEAATRCSDAGDLGVAVDVDADDATPRNEEFDEVGIEASQGAWAVVDDHCCGAGTRRDVGELEGDETSADEQHPLREPLEVQESGRWQRSPGDDDRDHLEVAGIGLQGGVATHEQGDDVAG